MTTLTPSTRHIPQFPTRSRLTLLRDAAMFGVCVALIVGFIAHAWTLPTPAQLRSSTSPVTLRTPV
ncbi:hypothetical protein [Anaeromyxobacter oryzae]|uniref:Uncharacterized protein n=1 Tax=Anaeromyxobacter oryzae TaxID=2918170 RepID=A0ABM7WQ52_9BACT|nr:hypothetical protein [Anaeromyxobacter oryzae]BDG01602.1 hypothetical protein AMOR_05980 [Anaeromyxobacter oryzae]